MKTTNFEISKKLAEIGFEHRTDFYHIADEKCKSRGENSDDYELEYISMFSEESYKLKKHYNIPSYDLETLLEVLPKELDKFLGITYLTLNKSNSGINIGYGNDEEYVENLYCWQEENESLADTAGRLLIKLHEAGIINFKE